MKYGDDEDSPYIVVEILEIAEFLWNHKMTFIFFLLEWHKDWEEDLMSEVANLIS